MGDEGRFVCATVENVNVALLYIEKNSFRVKMKRLKRIVNRKLPPTKNELLNIPGESKRDACIVHRNSTNSISRLLRMNT